MSQQVPTTIVIFGITGDLSQRYLLPALYHLFKESALHTNTQIIGVTRRETTAEELFDQVELCVNEVDKVCDSQVLQAMREHTSMLQMDLEDQASYIQLNSRLEQVESEAGMCMNPLYYLAVPPGAYTAIIDSLGAADLNKSCHHGKAVSRLMIEKPFGHDLDSAKKLIAKTTSVFEASQLYLIDHYMAKPAVSDIINFRLDNPSYKNIWDSQHIHSVTISAKEKIGIEGRATFYDNLGALRDFIQSHLVQLLSLVAMEQPEPINSQSLHAAKQALLHQVDSIPSDKITEMTKFGQYTGYRDEVKDPDSKTETYAAVTTYIKNPRWQGVPFKLVTGKNLDERRAEIRIEFKPGAGIPANELVYQIHPEAGRPKAYERVILEAIRGDQTLFASSDEVLESWRILQPILDAWQDGHKDLVTYQPGSNGP